MRKTLLRHKKDIFKVLGLVVFFALIRNYQHVLFYDPLLDYFEYDYLYKDYPFYEPAKLYGHLIFRYVLNSLVSLTMLNVLFKNTSYFKFAIVLYVGALALLLFLFFIAINFTTYENYQFLFYIRRFIIQPLLVLLFIPAFYFQKKHVRR
jgi:exosortase F-associated protein